MKPLRHVLSVFDKSTVMVKPWVENGYIAYCIDIQHSYGMTWEGNICKIGLDVLKEDVFGWVPKDIEIAFFFPPCTNLAVSGARWFKDKGLDGLIEGLTLFNKAIELAKRSGAPYMIENPVSTVSSYYRKPDHIFQPWEYGDLYNKKTCLWTGNGFKMPGPIHAKKPEGVTDMIHRMPPSKDRGEKRAITPRGFAKAVFEANRRKEPQRGLV